MTRHNLPTNINVNDAVNKHINNIIKELKKAQASFQEYCEKYPPIFIDAHKIIEFTEKRDTFSNTHVAKEKQMTKFCTRKKNQPLSTTML